MLTNFPVQLAAISAVLLALSIAARARAALVLTIVSALLSGIVVWNTVASETRTARVDSPSLTIGHLNAQTRSIDIDAFGRFIRDRHPDVFVVLDPTQRDAAELTAAAPGYRVHQTGSARGRAAEFVRTVVLTRVPVGEVEHPRDARFGPSAVEITVRGPAPLALVVFGTDSPTTPARALRRDRVLDAAGSWSRTQPARRVVMGDFNTTPWSPSFQRLLHRGRLFNSLDGFGLQPSWPTSNVLLGIPIDHALLGPALAATERATGPTFGSQHRSLLVTVTAAK